MLLETAKSLATAQQENVAKMLSCVKLCFIIFIIIVIIGVLWEGTYGNWKKVDGILQRRELNALFSTQSCNV